MKLTWNLSTIYVYHYLKLSLKLMKYPVQFDILVNIKLLPPHTILARVYLALLNEALKKVTL